ncbi:MAG: LLM class flavin-dependent oxidoreductase [Nitrososphaerota archaeon]
MNSEKFEIGIDASFTFLFDEDYTLRYLVKMERAGFDVVWLGDHFYPWHHSFKHNFYVWSLLPVVLSKTKAIKGGVAVTVPIGGRYHPALIAQASATIDVMFPGRFLLGVGSGEAMNESPFFGFWPKWEERIERLVEGVELIKRLWREQDFFKFEGKYYKMPLAFLYLKPKAEIPIYFSAMGEKSAYVAGKYADRLLTVASLERYRTVILPNFEKGCLESGRDPNTIEKAVSFGGGIGDTKEVVNRIKTYIAGASLKEMFNEPDPRKIFEAGSNIDDEQILRSMCISETGADIIETFEQFRKLGVNQVIWGDFSTNINKMLRIFKTKIIPYFKEATKE